MFIRAAWAGLILHGQRMTGIFVSDGDGASVFSPWQKQGKILDLMQNKGWHPVVRDVFISTHTRPYASTQPISPSPLWAPRSNMATMVNKEGRSPRGAGRHLGRGLATKATDYQ